MSRLVVKSHRPWQFASAIILLSALTALVTWLMLDRSHWSFIYDRITSSREDRLLWEVNQGLEQERAALQERVLMLERTASLDKQTAAMLQDDIKKLQEQVFRQKRELEFYRGVMDAASQTKGLGVHGIHIEPLSRERTYHLKVILTHVTKSDIVAEGTLVVSFEGNQRGAAKTMGLQELALDSGLDLSFKFRNFKTFDADFALPEGFTPQRVIVQLQSRDEKQAKIKKSFDWPVTAS